MLDKNTLIKVTNRDNGSVGYSIPDLGNLERVFTSGETKEVTMEELRKLSYSIGGKVILDEYLIIHNEEAIAELLGTVEPEYYYQEEDVKNLLEHGSLDELKDCLDFAPEGVIELIKKIAVETELPDTLKRAAITKKTGFNIDNAIMVNRVMDEPIAEEKNEEKVRRTAPISISEETKTRRANLPKYNVVNIKTN